MNGKRKGQGGVKSLREMERGKRQGKGKGRGRIKGKLGNEKGVLVFLKGEGAKGGWEVGV